MRSAIASGGLYERTTQITHFIQIAAGFETTGASQSRTFLVESSFLGLSKAPGFTGAVAPASLVQ